VIVRNKVLADSEENVKRDVVESERTKSALFVCVQRGKRQFADGPLFGQKKLALNTLALTNRGREEPFSRQGVNL
jgi:hypothetical protein